MPPQLMALSDGPNILLDKPILLIGRHQECDIQIPSRKISRRHCCIAQVNDHLVVRDLGSTNGIRVNGVRVLEGKLKNGDELIIGNFKYQVRLQLSPAPPPAAPPKASAPKPPAPHVVVQPLASPYDSNDEPVPLAEPVEAGPGLFEPILPTNKSNPPEPKEMAALPAAPVDDIPNAIMPESMSLEPLSEEYQSLVKERDKEKK